MNFIQRFNSGMTGNETTIVVHDYEQFESVVKTLKHYGFTWLKSGELVDSFNAYAERLNNGTPCFIVIRKSKKVSYSTNQEMILRKHPRIIEFDQTDWDDVMPKTVAKKPIYEFETTNRTKGTEKEVKNMNKNGIKGLFAKAMDFGFLNSGDVKLSTYGIAVRNTANEYVSYDTANDEIVNVNGLTFDIDHSVMKMPVTIDKLSVGDYILFNNNVIVVKKVSGSDVKGINLRTQTNTNVKYAKSPFGLNYMTKLVTLFNLNGTQNDTGNMMLPLLLSDSFDKSDMMTIMALGGFMGTGNGAINPMMLAMLFNDDDSDSMSMKDVLMFSMMTGQSNPFAGLFGTPTTSTPTTDTDEDATEASGN